MQKITKIKGFPDLIASDADKFSLLESTAAKVFQNFGFKEIRIPVLEKTELYSRSIGTSTDIVQKEMYTFADRKDRSVTMRPEATAGIVRAYIENRLYRDEEISKLYTYGPMFRYERPQKGRQRQFHQINAEILGTSSAYADTELILMLHDYLQDIGLHKLNFELNTLGCRKCRNNYLAALHEFLRPKAEDSLCQDCKIRIKSNPLRLLDCKNEKCRETLGQAPKIIDYVCTDCREHFQAVTTSLERAGIQFSINDKLVRGLDYYQRTAFEVVSEDIGAQAAVAGGGRYDGLIQDLGGPDLPGVGFACGMERLAMLVPQTLVQAYDFYLAILTEQASITGQILSHRLRRKGLSGLVSFEAKSAKSQMRHANRVGAKICFILGEEEIKKGVVQSKDMTTGEQNEIRQEDITAVFGRKG